MSARQRSEAFHNAVHKGKRAYRRGEGIETNPYKFSTYGNGSAWRMGWLEAQREAEELTK